MPDTYDAIVLGLGAMGAAATYQLAKRGAKVLGIDQYSPPHELGSTHGETRITRVACGEGPEYTAFAARSHEIWRELEAETGLELLTQNGFLAISGAGDRSSNHGVADFLGGTVAAAKAAGIRHEILDASAMRRRYPAFGVADGDTAYHDSVGGFVRPEECITAQLRMATRFGATLGLDERVVSFDQADGVVTVRTGKGTHRARQLIVSAGAWLPGLLGPTLSGSFMVTRQVLYWFRARSEAAHADFAPERFPVYIWQLPRHQSIYGFPALGGIEDGVKLATEQYDVATTPQSVSRTVDADETREMYETYVEPFFPGLSPVCVRRKVCMYTWVDQARFIIDRHPALDRVIIASPCSGHGFKHSAGIGELLAEMVTDGKKPDPRFAFS